MPTYNNGPRIDALFSSRPHHARIRKPSLPCLPERLPNLAFLEREATQNAPLAVIKQLRLKTKEPSEDNDDEKPSSPNEDELTRQRTRSITSDLRTAIRKPVPPPKPPGWKPPQPFEIFRAIERKDIMFL